MFRTLSPRDSISIALRKLLQGGRTWSQAIFKFAQKGASSIKLRNVAFFVWEDASLWAHWIHSFPIHLSYLWPILFPCSACFLHSPSSSAITVGRGSIPWMEVLGALIHIWRPKITDGCDISCLSVLAGDIFISQPYLFIIPSLQPSLAPD